jgi:hypothetical protein
MEELYPGKAAGVGFKVDGFARACKAATPSPWPEPIGQVITGFYPFGPRCFFVHQAASEQTPTFVFRPLTVSFLSNAIGPDPTFEFSLTQRRLGDITYVSGAAARDEGETQQGTRSLHASGGWTAAGLRLHFVGELSERSAFLDRPTPGRFRHDTYEVVMDVPWSALRFIFYCEMGFVVQGHQRYGPASS